MNDIKTVEVEERVIKFKTEERYCVVLNRFICRDFCFEVEDAPSVKLAYDRLKYNCLLKPFRNKQRK